MSFNRSDCIILIKQRVQDHDDRLTNEDFDRALNGAVMRFSRDKPRDPALNYIAQNAADVPANAYHEVTETGTTIADLWKEAVCDYAGHLLCHDLATLYSNDSDSSLGADSVDHNSKAEEFRNRSKWLWDRYFSWIKPDQLKQAEIDAQSAAKKAIPAYGVVKRFTSQGGWYGY